MQRFSPRVHLSVRYPGILPPLVEPHHCHNHIIGIQSGRSIQPARHERDYCSRRRKKLHQPHPVALADFENQKNQSGDKGKNLKEIGIHSLRVATAMT